MTKKKKYTKAEILKSISTETGLKQDQIRCITDIFIREIKTALTESKTIELRGFGTFEIKVRKGRAKAHNPRTGEIVSVQDHGIAVFRPGRELKQSVWGITSLEK
ncbi:MAG: integration host factor subunit beta [Treponema sp.]|jgi:integration host factor subunit beta|nr:integration host factor subunit beta [Treponema sp.]